MKTLQIQGMADRHPGLTHPLATTYLDAARVCLDRHHVSPISFDISEAGETRLEWELTDEHCRGAYANDIDTTEMGAYACSIASIELARGLFAVRRAETLTGADYYLAPEDTAVLDLESCVRLEVSGSDIGSHADLLARLRQKVKQARNGQSNLPALAVVVGFKSRCIFSRDVF